MWNDNKKPFFQEFSTPPPPPRSKRPWNSAPCTPIQNLEKNPSSQTPSRTDSFHVIHKVPNGDSPYVKAKHVQLIDKDPSKAISLFWSAINAGDRVDSALKDMAIVMKQLDRTDEAIEAVKSFRHLCTPQAQESLDNVLIDLYKRGGRIKEHIELLEHKLKLIDEGVAFGGKRTKLAKSQGKKFHVSVDQEKSRILGNLAWAYMQQCNYTTAEELYRKALSIEPDKNKQCNLAICLMNMGQTVEAKSLLQAVTPSLTEREISDPFIKSFDRACEMLIEFESEAVPTLREEIKDIPRIYTSPISLNSRPMTPIREEKSCDSSAQKWKRGSYSYKQLEEEKFDSSGFDKGRWNIDRGFEEKGSFQSSRYSPFADKKETCSRRLFERGSGLSGFKNVELASDSRTEECGANKNINTYGSPFAFNRSSRLRSGEPRCGVQSSSSGGWRTSFDYDANKKQAMITVSRSPTSRERKCSLQSSPGGDWRRPWDCDADNKQGMITAIRWPTSREQKCAVQSSANVDWRMRSSDYDADKNQATITPARLPKSRVPQSSANGDWRRRSSYYDADEKQAVLTPARSPMSSAPKFGSQSSANGDRRRRSLDYEADNRQVIGTQTKSPSVACPGTIPVNEVGGELHAFSGEHLDQRSEVTVSDSMSEHIGGKDNQEEASVPAGSTTGDSAVKHQYFPSFKSGKSWADMAEEEEEEELLRECTNTSISTCEYSYQESSASFQTPSKSDIWNDGEFFNDENMDSNIIGSTPRPPTSTFCPPSSLITQPRRDDYTKNIRRKLELVDLNEGQTKSTDSYSSKNSTARRALAFEKTDSADFFRLSPLRKVLFTEDDDSAATKDSNKVSRGNKRLQVFQEITL